LLQLFNRQWLQVERAGEVAAIQSASAYALSGPNKWSFHVEQWTAIENWIVGFVQDQSSICQCMEVLMMLTECLDFLLGFPAVAVFSHPAQKCSNWISVAVRYPCNSTWTISGSNMDSRSPSMLLTMFHIAMPRFDFHCDSSLFCMI
jgi:hypothetical protein